MAQLARSGVVPTATAAGDTNPSMSGLRRVPKPRQTPVGCPSNVNSEHVIDFRRTLRHASCNGQFFAMLGPSSERGRRCGSR